MAAQPRPSRSGRYNPHARTHTHTQQRTHTRRPPASHGSTLRAAASSASGGCDHPCFGGQADDDDDYMARLAHLKEVLQERFPTVEDVRAQAPKPNEFAGDVADHKTYESLNPMVVRLRHATRRAAARSIPLHAAADSRRACAGTDPHRRDGLRRPHDGWERALRLVAGGGRVGHRRESVGLRRERGLHRPDEAAVQDQSVPALVQRPAHVPDLLALQ